MSWCYRDLSTATLGTLLSGQTPSLLIRWSQAGHSFLNCETTNRTENSSFVSEVLPIENNALNQQVDVYIKIVIGLFQPCQLLPPWFSTECCHRVHQSGMFHKRSEKLRERRWRSIKSQKYGVFVVVILVVAVFDVTKSPKTMNEHVGESRSQKKWRQ